MLSLLGESNVVQIKGAFLDLRAGLQKKGLNFVAELLWLSAERPRAQPANYTPPLDLSLQARPGNLEALEW